MIKYTKKERNSVLRKDLKQYEVTIGPLTPEERKELRKWVKGGNSPYDNPCLFCDENGRTMDYITAIRIHEDMCANPEDYHFVGLCNEDDDLPF
jgi:hypothetical protein